MRKRPRGRWPIGSAGLAVAVAMAVHLLLLAAFVLTMKVAGAPRDERSVVASLVSPLFQDRGRRPAPRPRAAAPIPAAALEQAPPAVPAASGPPPMAPRPDENLERFGASLRDLFGCNDPDLYRLTAAERARCDARIEKQAKAAPFIPAPMAPDKRAAFDRRVKCRAEYDQAHIPPGLEVSGTGGGLAGLGYTPRLRDCPPGDR